MHPLSTPINIRKLYGFLMFSGVREGVHWKQMGYETNLLQKTYCGCFLSIIF